MTARMKIWFLPALFFALFLFWYTPTGGPLSDAEVDNFIAENGAERQPAGGDGVDQTIW
jgi:lipopolysaccharide export LptBFGC system permease protein LptF